MLHSPCPCVAKSCCLFIHCLLESLDKHKICVDESVHTVGNTILCPAVDFIPRFSFEAGLEIPSSDKIISLTNKQTYIKTLLVQIMDHLLKSRKLNQCNSKSSTSS